MCALSVSWARVFSASARDMDATMFQLRSFVRQRLRDAAEQIIAEVDKTITLALYEVEVSPAKDEVESVRRQLGLLRETSVELPQTSGTGEHKNEWGTSLLLDNPGPSAPQESGFSLTGPAQPDADLGDDNWNYCLHETDFKVSDIKEEREENVGETQSQETVFTSPELVKSEQDWPYEQVSSESPAAQSESNDSGEDLVNSKAGRIKTSKIKGESPQRQSGNSNKKGRAVLPYEKRSAKSQKDRSFCHMCGMGFHYLGSLMKHIKTHDSPSDCTICRITFQSTKELISHLQSRHKKAHFCNICGKTFANNHCLKLHEKIHTGIKDFMCQECGRTFHRRDHLIVHLRTHSGEKPYNCDICGKAFSQSQNLTIHKRGHSGERPYHCDLCGKLFNTSSHLKAHMRYHSDEKPYQCDICGKHFRQSGQKTRHRITHTGERPYACHVCGHRYRFAGNLKVHMKTHERPAAK